MSTTCSAFVVPSQMTRPDATAKTDSPSTHGAKLLDKFGFFFFLALVMPAERLNPVHSPPLWCKGRLLDLLLAAVPSSIAGACSNYHR